MVNVGLLLSYYPKPNDARIALKELRRRGFTRLAMLQRPGKEGPKLTDPHRLTRAAAILAGGVLIGSLFYAVATLLGRLTTTYPRLLGIPLPVVLGSAVSMMLVWPMARRLWPAVDRQLLREHARWLLADETLILLQAPLSALRFALPLLTHFGETQPAVFVLHPLREQPEGGIGLIHLPLPAAQIRPHAASLAEEHAVGPAPPGDRTLLQTLDAARQSIHSIAEELENSVHLNQSLSGTSEWILDNEYVVETHAKDVLRNLPGRFYVELPALTSGPDHGLPRIYSLARELVVHTDLRVDRQSILEFLEGYQSVHTLTMGELWAVPLMLRVALIEAVQGIAFQAVTELRDSELADFWGNRLLATARLDPGQLFAMLAEMADQIPDPGPYFGTQLIGHLYDDEAALVPAQSWLERTLRRPLGEVNLLEQNRQATDQVSIGNAITSLRQLALMDWREVFEAQSHVDRILRMDPSGTYSRMDFDTRDSYRQAVEQLARVSGAAETQVARAAVGAARQQVRSREPGLVSRHVGHHLIGDGRAALRASLECREPFRFRLRGWVYRHHTAVYLSGIALFTAAAAAAWIAAAGAMLATWAGIVIAILLLGPASQLAQEIVNYLVTRLLPPRTLPKMDFETGGVPDAFRTLVVAPVLMVDRRTIQEEAEKLEIRYLANPEANLLFSLFTDFTDADQETMPQDAGLLQTAVECIQALNQRHGSNRFYLFHRGRTWTESEQKYIGWERKRGKLEELNRFLDGSRPPDAPQLVYVGEPEGLAEVRFVITLDSDTALPRDSARRLIETLAHPLNQPRLDEHGQRVVAGYTIIQPRVSPSLPSAVATPFSRLFTDPIGVDPYTKAVSEAYQDLSGEASYHGKGIYDVRAFSRVLSGRFPEQRLLSHDLIEGAYVRVGLASDIELFDEFPPDYPTYTRRQHRWLRGDWQIAEWIAPRVPGPDGKRLPNPLSTLNRWKITDNLRRSLVPAMSIGLLAVSWMLGPRTGLLSSAFLAVMVLFRPLAQPFTWATTQQGLKGVSLRQIGHDLIRSLAEAALLLHDAAIALDAITRIAYRRLISKRRLLEWTPAQIAQWSAEGQLSRFLLSTGLVTAVSAALGAAVYALRPESLPIAAPWLGLWALTPLISWRLSVKPQAAPKRRSIAGQDLSMLRVIARRTWRFFDRFVNEETGWLPPDNYQVSHQDQLAMRTSPTNIGLWMLAALGAYDFGYLTGDQVIERLERTMATLERLERFAGHLFNWYDLQTLSPLEPRYVSSVDSGNLLAALWSLEHGLHELLHAPLLDDKPLSGLLDTLELLQQSLRVEGLAVPDPELIRQIATGLRHAPAGVLDRIRTLRRLHQQAATLAQQVHVAAELDSPAAHWALQFELQLSNWLHSIDRYLGWIEVLGELPDSELTGLDQQLRLAVRDCLAQPPSLAAVAGAQVPCIAAIRSALEGPIEGHASWGQRVLESFSHAQWLAGEARAAGEALADRVRAFAEQIDMRFLYDPQRRLFSIGYSVSEGRQDPAHYDLLASEARLGSFAAIARGDVPLEHWLSMARPYSSIGRRRVLLSWTGTMFEYLMPLLLQRTYPNSLLQKAIEEAVAIQIDYGQRRGVPWGISESAFGDLDLNKTYQYRAFGVPALGLKRGLEEDLVVAPYATLLAVELAPQAAVDNLKALARSGLLGDYGYFEAVDYSRAPRRGGERGVIVRAYMAHHHGMSFLALDNFVNDAPMRRRFHADRRVRSVEPLLYERIPISPPIHHVSTRERAAFRVGAVEVAPSTSTFDTPDTAMPKTQLLSNGRYSLMVTNAGGGYSRWGEADLTRWRSDTTRDHWGTFCYIRDRDSGALWSNTYQPVRGPVGDYTATFAMDRAEIRRTDDGIETVSEIIVSPEDDIEIRHISLLNKTGSTRELDITSYIELAMAPHRADLGHLAFNKLFVQTEALPALQALLAWRRRRTEDEPPLFVGHRLTFDQPTEGPFAFETDRRSFLGRGGTLERPRGATDLLGNSQGYVLDPIFSVRERLQLEPMQRRQFSLVLAAGEDRGHVVALLEKYSDPMVIDRAIEIAWAAAQLELRLLRIQPDEARRFQQLASHMLYPNHRLRPPAERLEENRKGQSGLWPYGISGDMPVALVSIGEVRDIGLVRQALQAHTYWRQHGLMADLVILNEEASGYEQPLNERLEKLIQAHSAFTGVDQPGGVFLRNVDQIPEEDFNLLSAVGRVSLVGARGSLAQQLAITELAGPPGPLKTKRAREEPSAPLPFLELPYFNGLGGFTADGREYVIYLGPEANTPAPWVNVIANPEFGTLISESGSGFSWYGNSQTNRLTEWSNDPVRDPPSEAIYIRDDETGIVWTPCPRPIRERDAYRARHGAGYSVFEHNSHAIEQQLIAFVPMDESGGEPVKVQRLTLKNDSSRRRKLSVTHYVEWNLGEHREISQMHTVTQWDEQVSALLATNGYQPNYSQRIAFASITPAADSYTGDRTEFLGRNGTMADPAALRRVELSGRTGAGFDPCAALQVRLELEPGEQTELICLLGHAGSVEAVHQLVRKYRDFLAMDSALSETQAWWDQLLGTLQVETPELSVNFLLNRWLQYQSLSCRIWGRSAFYQSGGAFGFRDQLQDVLAFLHAYPELTRAHILRAAGRQFREGDVQHWWHSPGGGGIRSRISDDLLWLPFAVSKYVRATGDASILQEKLPFLDAPPLERDQSEAYLTPEVTLEQATLFEHCQRAVKRAQNFGPHGLPLIGGGDWNDGMNRVGLGGRGESVWLAWFLIEVLERMAELAELADEVEFVDHYHAGASALAAQVEHEAWDGAWYLRATFDDGSPIGSWANAEAMIDSLPQSWAWLSGAGQPERAAIALESAWKHLVKEQERLVLLFTPPFDRAQPTPGYIRAYPPGVRENGGQYTHAALWLAIAAARSGDAERANRLLQLLNPIEGTKNLEGVRRYAVEPYVMAADVYSLPGRLGQGGWSWYTGSAAWMYRAWVEEVLGLKLRGERLTIEPVIPGWWQGFRLTLRHGEAVYEISVENPDGRQRGVASVHMDGRLLPDRVIPLARDLVKHRVRVVMG